MLALAVGMVLLAWANNYGQRSRWARSDKESNGVAGGRKGGWAAMPVERVNMEIKTCVEKQRFSVAGRRRAPRPARACLTPRPRPRPCMSPRQVPAEGAVPGAAGQAARNRARPASAQRRTSHAPPLGPPPAEYLPRRRPPGRCPPLRGRHRRRRSAPPPHTHIPHRASLPAHNPASGWPGSRASLPTTTAPAASACNFHRVAKHPPSRIPQDAHRRRHLPFGLRRRTVRRPRHPAFGWGMGGGGIERTRTAAVSPWAEFRRRLHRRPQLDICKFTVMSQTMPPLKVRSRTFPHARECVVTGAATMPDGC